MIGCDDVDDDDDEPYGVRREGSLRLPLSPPLPKKTVSRTRMRSFLPPLRLPASEASSGTTLLQSRTWSSWWLCSMRHSLWLGSQQLVVSTMGTPTRIFPAFFNLICRSAAVAPPQCNAVGCLPSRHVMLILLLVELPQSGTEPISGPKAATQEKELPAIDFAFATGPGYRRYHSMLL